MANMKKTGVTSMKKEEARRAVLSEYDRWAKKHPSDARMMSGFLFFRYLQKEKSERLSSRWRAARPAFGGKADIAQTFD